jgi:hypothetical protein
VESVYQTITTAQDESNLHRCFLFTANVCIEESSDAHAHTGIYINPDFGLATRHANEIECLSSTPASFLRCRLVSSPDFIVNLTHLPLVTPQSISCIPCTPSRPTLSHHVKQTSVSIVSITKLSQTTPPLIIGRPTPYSREPSVPHCYPQ